ncbi:MAG: D-alanyl-D-alanine carboxypeptidase family protein [Thermomicrobiales bacterium]
MAILLTLSLAAAPARDVVAQSAALPAAPDVTAKAVYSIDVSAGVELLAQNADDELPPASTTKIASALVIVGAVRLDEQVTVDPLDAEIEGESSMHLVPGDVVTVEDLLYGMMLPSGNDAARSAARYVGSALLAKEGGTGDPVDRFVQAMNELATGLGLRHTHFTNPAGLQDPKHYSSAHDMAVLGGEAMTHKEIAKIVGTKEKTVVSAGPLAQSYELVNSNALLRDGYPGVHGTKTGTTPEAGACLVIAKWEHGRNRVITVILGSRVEFDANGVTTLDRRYDDMTAILKALDGDYLWVDPTKSDEVPGLQAELAAWQVGMKDDSSVVAPRRADAPLKYVLELGPEGSGPGDVGKVLFFVGSDQIAERSVSPIDPGSGGG